MNSPSAAARPRTLAEPDRSDCRSPVSYEVAGCLSQVEKAWSLVYERYVDTGLIAPNPFGLHTHPHALHADTCVVFGRCSCDNSMASTMTLIADSRHGLALDSVYRRELDALRHSRRQLLEVGLLVADCSIGSSRGMTALFELMKWGVYYALCAGVTDIVIGVHPHHAKFYSRCFAFEQFGPETSYPIVRNRPVVPLRLRLNEQLAPRMLPRGLRHVRNNPVDGEAFAGRYAFSRHSLASSRVERFIAATHKHESPPLWHVEQPRAPLVLALQPA